MKAARRLRWRGPAQQQRVREELERRLGAWLQGWSVDARWLSLAPSEAGALGEFVWQRAQLNGASAWVGMAWPGSKMCGMFALAKSREFCSIAS